MWRNIEEDRAVPNLHGKRVECGDVIIVPPVLSLMSEVVSVKTDLSGSISTREACARKRRKRHGRARRRPAEAKPAYSETRYRVEVEESVEEASP